MTDPKPEDITAVIDTREQTPLDLSPLRWEPGTLATGDYSILGLENVVSVERKSIPDLMGCIGQDRERFDREIMRLLAYPHRLVVVEGLLSDIESGTYRSRVAPSAAMGSLLGWMAMGIPFLFAGSHEAAGRLVSRFLFIAARRRWRESEALRGRHKNIAVDTTDKVG